MFVLFLPLLCAIQMTGGPGAAITGRIVDQSGLPLPGVQVTVKPLREDLALDRRLSRSVVTEEDGRFSIDLPVGHYRLTADLAGFGRVERAIDVGADPLVLDLTMVVGVEEQVSVTAPAEAIIGQPQTAVQSTVTRDVIDVAMLPNNTFDDVLPLMPNVVRGPDGLISVAGARAPQGQMLVNGISQADPVLGDPDIMLPLDPIGSVQVLSNGYPSEFGRASGGVTLVQMRSASDTLHVNFNSFDPRLHFADGGIRGIEAFEPNFGLSGPIVKQRLWFTQGLDYRFVRNSFDTLAGSQDNRYDAVLSWSSLEWAASASHHVSAWLSADPQTTDHADIGAFTPAATVPGLRRGGWRAAITDRTVFGTATTLELSGIVTELTTRVTPAGDSPFIVGHDLTRGNYFNRQDRHASRVEASGALTHEIGGGEPLHIIKAGGSIGRLGFEGIDQSARVVMLRSDGTIARIVDFEGDPHLAARGTEVALFAQDTWRAGSSLTVDAGIRYDKATLADGGVLAPRIGATWKIDASTTLSGGAGVFSDKMTLGAAAFASMQSRVVTEFDSAAVSVSSGSASGSQTYANRFAGIVLMPYARSWHLQLDRRFERGVITRLSYQQRSGADEPTVDVLLGPDGQNALTLGSVGRSRSRSLEATAGYRSASAGRSVYVSYVRSSSMGDLNDFGSIEGNFKEPFVQSNQFGPLAADVPNRVLAWGFVRLPARVTIAPFIEVRDGFPFSSVDDEWRFVGGRNGERFPTFASFDFFVNKLVKLPGHLPTARIGVKLYNITSAGNWRDIQRDAARPDFRATYNPIPRELRSVFELLWGQK